MEHVMPAETLTRSQAKAADVAALWRARAPLLWIDSREEARVERYLAAAAKSIKYGVITWDVAVGFADATGEPLKEPEGSRDPGVALDFIRERAKGGDRTVWVLRDFPTWLTGPAGATTLRQLRNLARSLPDADLASTQAVVVLSPTAEVPAELADHATVIEWPLPDRAEIGEVLDEAVKTGGDKVEPLNGKREAAIDAAVGLTEGEAVACFNRSLVQLRKIDPAIVAAEKRRVISREKVLEWYDPLPGGLDAVGGLDNLKTWLRTRASAYSPAARAYGLPSPKGVLIVGIPGTGKSLTAKAASTTWGIPLIRMDLGALKSKFVGDSEANIRRAFKVIEAVGRCVVWLDEIEKALQGSTSGSSDGGTSSDQLGAILSWMQERSSEAFVIATANDVSALPPELLRKGRFDELFFVDLPNRSERIQITMATLKTFGRKSHVVDVAAVADATTDFTGAEIAAIVPEAMFTAFNDGAREISTDDLLQAARDVVPLSKTAAPKIKALRDWANGKARSASVAEEKAPERKLRALDI
jgi:ATP-dependent 26S proteasome regulatory subunit